MKELEELQGEARSVADQLSIWRSFLNHSGWKLFEETVMSQLEMQRGMLMTPLETLDGVPRQEFMKGELYRAGLLLGLPETQLEVLKVEQERLQKEIEDVTRDAGEVGADGASRRSDEQRRDILDDDTDAFGDHGS